MVGEVDELGEAMNKEQQSIVTGFLQWGKGKIVGAQRSGVVEIQTGALEIGGNGVVGTKKE